MIDNDIGVEKDYHEFLSFLAAEISIFLRLASVSGQSSPAQAP